MHDMRLGFGQEKIVSLNETIDSYICKYGDKDTQLLDAIAVLFLYDDVHKKAGFQLPAHIQKIINDKREKYPSIPILEQDFSTPAGYYARINSNFKDFSASRHSIRNFVGEIPVAQIVDAIDIAKMPLPHVIDNLRVFMWLLIKNLSPSVCHCKTGIGASEIW